MFQQIDDIIAAWLSDAQARLLACMAHHTLAQIIVLAVYIVMGGVIELSVLS